MSTRICFPTVSQGDTSEADCNKYIKSINGWEGTCNSVALTENDIPGLVAALGAGYSWDPVARQVCGQTDTMHSDGSFVCLSASDFFKTVPQSAFCSRGTMPHK
jgi:hypothetical protein